MAGIAFELKKLFRKGSVFSTLTGSLYATMTTIGPTIMIIAVLLTMYMTLGYMSLNFARRELLSSTFLYVFIFAMILTSPICNVLSRYIADRIFDERLTDIMASYHLGLLFTAILCALLGIPFVLMEVRLGGVDPLFAFVSYCMFVSLSITFFSMTYVSALKEYRRITYSFLGGMGLALLLGFVFHLWLGVETADAILYSFTIGFALSAMLLYIQIKAYFRGDSHNYRDALRYFKKYGVLFLCNLFYTLGLYIHNFVIWGSDLTITVARVFHTAPPYDVATCIAMFTNISLTIIFVVHVETRFHDKYQAFCEAVIGGRNKDIQLAKNAMFRTLAHEMTFIIQLQVIITVLLFLCCMVFMPMIGISGLILNIYPVLAVAYLMIFVTHSLMVFLYYFEDYRGALITTLSFFTATLLASYVAREWLSYDLYGMGAFVGAFVGWTVGFFRIKSLERNFDTIIFCRGHIVPTRRAAGGVSKVIDMKREVPPEHANAARSTAKP